MRHRDAAAQQHLVRALMSDCASLPSVDGVTSKRPRMYTMLQQIL